MYLYISIFLSLSLSLSFYLSPYLYFSVTGGSSSKAGRLETQEELIFLFESECGKILTSQLTQSGREDPSYSAFCSIQVFSWLDEDHLHLGG